MILPIEKLLSKRFNSINDNTLLQQSKVYACYEKSMKSLFVGFDDEKIAPDLFSNTIRSLLVHNILNNIEMHHLKRTKILLTLRNLINNDLIEDLVDNNESSSFDRGLDFMISEKIFKTAFVLHDETSHMAVLQDLMEKAGSLNNTAQYFNAINKNFKFERLNKEQDIRLDLAAKWAHIKNLFKFQPINMIRDYFGEEVAFYFVWVGVLLTCLWVPSIIGIIFFFIGLSIRYFNFLFVLLNFYCIIQIV